MPRRFDEDSRHQGGLFLDNDHTPPSIEVKNVTTDNHRRERYRDFWLCQPKWDPGSQFKSYPARGDGSADDDASGASDRVQGVPRSSVLNSVTMAIRLDKLSDFCGDGSWLDD